MNKFAKSAIFHPFWDHFQIVKLVQHKCQNQLVISNIKHPKPKYLLFLGVTYIHPCLKQLRYQKKMQVTHSTVHAIHVVPCIVNTCQCIICYTVHAIHVVYCTMYLVLCRLYCCNDFCHPGITWGISYHILHKQNITRGVIIYGSKACVSNPSIQYYICITSFIFHEVFDTKGEDCMSLQTIRFYI